MQSVSSVMRYRIAILVATIGLSGCQPTPMTQLKKEEPAAPQFKNETKPDSQSKSVSMVDKSTKAYNPLSKEEERVIVHKGTERAFTGEYWNLKSKGTFICRRCNAPLYTSDTKFDSECGWPSFDDQIGDSVERHLDADGYRVEIVCKNCGGHLGHVFEGEKLTPKDTRHCVNSISVRFIPDGEKLPEVIKLDPPSE
jgi:peptide-methionine (R)-S-oxide reductase